MKAKTFESQLQLHDFKNSTSNFTFIPYGLDAKLSKEAVKVHVLHGRKRQKNGRSKQDRNLHGQMFAWDSKVKPNKELQSQKGVLRDLDANGNILSGPQSVAPMAREQYTRHVLCEVDHVLSIDHHVLRNPFVDKIKRELGQVSTYRIRSMNYLVDHYMNRCGASKFPRELLSRYWQDSACFKAFLAHAATLFTLETELEPPIAIDELMCSALNEVRRRLSDSTQSQADGTVLAVTILANVEEGRTQRENAAWHWRGLKQLLRMRGTFSSLRMHRDLHSMLLWREILSSNSYDFCLGHGLADTPELQHCNEHLISFFQGFAAPLCEGPRDQKPHDDNVQSFLATMMNRCVVRKCEWTCSMQRRAEIACLTYLAMLAESAGVSAETRRLMEKVKQEVIQRDTWGQVSQEELLFIMLHHERHEQEWRCQRLWQLSRCIFMTRDLDMKDWKTLRDMLSLYLGVQHGCDRREDVLAGWEDLSKRLLLTDECCSTGIGKCHKTGWVSSPSYESQ